MASSNDYLIYILDLLREVRGVTYKKMMGEYILYKDGIIFGGIYDNRFLVKKTAYSSGLGLKEQIPYPIRIICESALKGKIYEFGNYNDGKWRLHGITKGYA